MKIESVESIVATESEQVIRTSRVDQPTEEVYLEKGSAYSHLLLLEALEPFLNRSLGLIRIRWRRQKAKRHQEFQTDSVVETEIPFPMIKAPGEPLTVHFELDSSTGFKLNTPTNLLVTVENHSTHPAMIKFSISDSRENEKFSFAIAGKMDNNHREVSPSKPIAFLFTLIPLKTGRLFLPSFDLSTVKTHNSPDLNFHKIINNHVVFVLP